MTVGSSKRNCEYTNFAFGVPLEDIFSTNHIHPVLDNIFETAYNALYDCDYTLEVVVSKLSGSFDYILQLKENLLKNNVLNKTDSPGAYFWLLRHFLGLLPIPLLPKYANGQNFNWKQLSVQCKKYIATNEGPETKQFILKCSRELSNLPVMHIMLLQKFVKFSRRVISCHLYNGEHLRKNTAITLVKYYCGAVFCRPFQPGTKNEFEKTYQSLLLYLIIKWPLLDKYLTKYRLEKYTNLARISEKEEIVIKEEFICETEDEDKEFSKIEKDCEIARISEKEEIVIKKEFICETEDEDKEFSKIEKDCELAKSVLLDEEPEYAEVVDSVKQEINSSFENVQNIHKESIKKEINGNNEEYVDEKVYSETNNVPVMRLVPYVYYYNTDMFLKDISCQTERFEEYIANTSYKKFNEEIDRQIKIEPVSTDNETSENEIFIDKNTVPNNSSFDENVNNFAITASINQSVINTDNSDAKDVRSSKRKAYSNYIRQLRSKSANKKNITATLESLDEDRILQKYRKKAIKNGIYGWVYSATSDISDSDTDNYKNTRVVEENDNFQFDSCKSEQNLLSETDRDSSVMSKVLKIGWTYSPKDVSVKKTGDKKPEECSKSSKESFEARKSSKKSSKRLSLSSFSNKFASKLDFKRIFIGSNLNNSASVDEICKVKYNKIESAKSSIF